MTVKFTSFDTPPPPLTEGGLKTVTLEMPPCATSAGDNCAVSCVAFTVVVGRSPPFQRTTEPLTKFVPLTVRTNAALPADVDAGASVVNVGTGLLACEKVTVPGVNVAGNRFAETPDTSFAAGLPGNVTFVAAA